MEIILVHWQITPGKREAFIDHWTNVMKIGRPKGFYREILTEPLSKPDPKFNTFSVTDKNYDTFINIGIWESVEDFEAAIKAFLPPATETSDKGRTKRTVELSEFEFKLRERVVLRHIDDRGGDLPPPSLPDA